MTEKKEKVTGMYQTDCLTMDGLLGIFDILEPVVNTFDDIEKIVIVTKEVVNEVLEFCIKTTEKYGLVYEFVDPEDSKKIYRISKRNLD